MRAREPDRSGYVKRDGVSVYYEVFGEGPVTILFLPTWSLVHSRIWKAQIPYLARHFRVITFDGRGNGKSDRPTDTQAYSHQEFAEDAIAVLDATNTDQAIIVGYSLGGVYAAILASEYPQRIRGAVFIAPVGPFGDPIPERMVSWDDKLESTEGWSKHNRHYWLTNYADWVAFFASKIVNEPHSTKQIEDIIEWGSQTSAQVLIATYEAEDPPTSDSPTR